MPLPGNLSAVTVGLEGGKSQIDACYQAATLVKTATGTWLPIGALKA